ncbi:hypothetical protein SVAN01_09906 [Stagonosporopsis vannaccii]|nr:hypothetical protein SVAN01_09906 [Stagonosporopsis vannaccii]
MRVLSRETGTRLGILLPMLCTPPKDPFPARQTVIQVLEARLQHAHLARRPPLRGCRPVVTVSLLTRPQRQGRCDMRRLRAADVPPRSCKAVDWDSTAHAASTVLITASNGMQRRPARAKYCIHDVLPRQPLTPLRAVDQPIRATFSTVAAFCLGSQRVLGECVAGIALQLPHLYIVRGPSWAKRPLVESWDDFRCRRVGIAHIKQELPRCGAIAKGGSSAGWHWSSSCDLQRLRDEGLKVLMAHRNPAEPANNTLLDEGTADTAPCLPQRGSRHLQRVSRTSALGERKRHDQGLDQGVDTALDDQFTQTVVRISTCDASTFQLYC